MRGFRAPLDFRLTQEELIEPPRDFRSLSESAELDSVLLEVLAAARERTPAYLLATYNKPDCGVTFNRYGFRCFARWPKLILACSAGEGPK